MTPESLQQLSEQVHELAARRFWTMPDFWINLAVGIGSIIFSILAFVEAKRAKRAAIEAGKAVKLQTVTIELTEIAQKLDRVEPGMLFSDARDLLAEISRRLRRATAPYATDPELINAITAVREALDAAQESLRSVRPSDPTKENETPDAVYYGMESELASVNNCVADLMGLFEMKSVAPADSQVQRRFWLWKRAAKPLPPSAARAKAAGTENAAVTDSKE